MRIGIATPCHESDQNYLNHCIQSITRLKPQPAAHVIDINAGGVPLKQIREQLFDRAFHEEDCDVVLSCDADFFLFKNILRHIRSDQVTDFCALELPISSRFLSDMIQSALHLVYNGSWSGCFAIPLESWKNVVKPNWDGTDGSIKRTIGRNYHFVKQPQYYLMRPWQKETTEKLIQQMPLAQRMKWRMLRVK